MSEGPFVDNLMSQLAHHSWCQIGTYVNGECTCAPARRDDARRIERFVSDFIRGFRTAYVTVDGAITSYMLGDIDGAAVAQAQQRARALIHEES